MEVHFLVTATLDETPKHMHEIEKSMRNALLREKRENGLTTEDDATLLEVEVKQIAAIDPAKSFGWIIRRGYTERGEEHWQYLSQVHIGDEGVETTFSWANSRHNSELFDTEFKDAILKRLDNPFSPLEAIELFTA
jgi:hypothetical protein